MLLFVQIVPIFTYYFSKSMNDKYRKKIQTLSEGIGRKYERSLETEDKIKQFRQRDIW